MMALVNSSVVCCAVYFLKSAQVWFEKIGFFKRRSKWIAVIVCVFFLKTWVGNFFSLLKYRAVVLILHISRTFS